MAWRAAAIAKRLTGDGNKLPIVASRMQRELDYAVTGRVARLAVRLDRADLVEPHTAGADNEVAHAARVRFAVRIQLRKSFVDMIVTGDGDVHRVPEKNLDQTSHMRIVAVSLAGA